MLRTTYNYISWNGGLLIHLFNRLICNQWYLIYSGTLLNHHFVIVSILLLHFFWPMLFMHLTTCSVVQTLCTVTNLYLTVMKKRLLLYMFLRENIHYKVICQDVLYIELYKLSVIFLYINFISNQNEIQVVCYVVDYYSFLIELVWLLKTNWHIVITIDCCNVVIVVKL